MICPKNPDPKYDDYSKCECTHSRFDKDRNWSCGFENKDCIKIRNFIGSLQENIMEISAQTDGDIIMGIAELRKNAEFIEDISQNLLSAIEDLENQLE